MPCPLQCPPLAVEFGLEGLCLFCPYHPLAASLSSDLFICPLQTSSVLSLSLSLFLSVSVSLFLSLSLFLFFFFLFLSISLSFFLSLCLSLSPLSLSAWLLHVTGTSAWLTVTCYRDVSVVDCYMLQGRQRGCYMLQGRQHG